MAALKLKSLSLNGPNVSDLGQRISAIKTEVTNLLLEKSASPAEMISMIVNSLVEFGIWRRKSLTSLEFKLFTTSGGSSYNNLVL
jgi:hypothetical protein